MTQKRSVPLSACGLASLLMLVPPARAQSGPVTVPEPLNEVVFGARKRRQITVRIDGHAFRAIASPADTPCLLWNADVNQPFGLAHDRAAVLGWLAKIGRDLGHRDFQPRFVASSEWRGAEVWDFDLVRKGLLLLDTKVRVFWKKGTFLGLVTRFPLPVTAVAEPTADDRTAPDRVYFAERQADASYHLILATLQRQETATHVTTSVVTPKGTAYRLVEQKNLNVAPESGATFTEYPVPVGRFPDQIWADSTGLIWFSQPSDNYVTSLDPKTSRFTQYPTTGGQGPDGLWVDDQDRVWTGLYYSSHLGVLDVATKKFQAIPAPYSPANLAIPSPSSHGTVWVTDHRNNRISEYDPVHSKWLQSLVMPTPGTWVTAGTLDPTRETVYFTGYYSNTLPCKPLGQAIVDIPVPSRGGPAFLTYHDDKIWFSLWNTNRLGEYDVTSKKITEYAFLSGELGGPMSITPNGEPVVGTRSLGYIVVFDPVKKTFLQFKIPTAIGLKDGLTVAPDGAIWFTGTTSSNKIGRLVVK